MSAAIADLRRWGFGELTCPAIEAWTARGALFESTRRLCEQDIAQLRNNCLPTYGMLFEHGRKQFPKMSSDVPVILIVDGRVANSQLTEVNRSICINDWQSLSDAATYQEIACQLRNDIVEWARCLGLEAVWFLEAALFNIRAWHLDSGARAILRWDTPEILIRGSSEQFGSLGADVGFYQRVKGFAALAPPPSSLPVYNPILQTSSDYRHSNPKVPVEYLRLQERRFREVGFTDTRAKRRRYAELWTHADWFVQYHIQRRTTKQILADLVLTSMAEENVPTESGLNRAVRRISRMLQISLRPSRREPAKKSA